jgi:hypothetical protein
VVRSTGQSSLPERGVSDELSSLRLRHELGGGADAGPAPYLAGEVEQLDPHAQLTAPINEKTARG